MLKRSRTSRRQYLMPQINQDNVSPDYIGGISESNMPSSVFNEQQYTQPTCQSLQNDMLQKKYSHPRQALQDITNVGKNLLHNFNMVEVKGQDNSHLTAQCTNTHFTTKDHLHSDHVGIGHNQTPLLGRTKCIDGKSFKRISTQDIHDLQQTDYIPPAFSSATVFNPLEPSDPTHFSGNVQKRTRQTRHIPDQIDGEDIADNNQEIYDDSSDEEGYTNCNIDSGYLDEGDPTYTCKWCGARMWYNERIKKGPKATYPSFFLCCGNGKIQLPPMLEPPPYLKKLFFDKNSPESKKFLSNIRSYNNMFSFTSMGGQVNHSINSGQGPYSFVLSGQNYHKIGSLLPPKGKKPVYSQLYIYDTDNEIENRISVVSKHQKKDVIDPQIANKIMHELDAINIYVQEYRLASAMLQANEHVDIKLCLLSKRDKDGRTYNLPSSSEVAALVVGDLDMSYNARDIIVEKRSGELKRINETHTAYLPLQYPLLFPYGEDGYRDDIPHRNSNGQKNQRRDRVTIREYLAYKLMARQNEMSLMLSGRKLFQQFIVDGYTMMESQRLQFIRTHQKELRVDMYQGISEAIMRGDTSASSVGKRVILPSSFTGGARYLIQTYQDAMAICRWAGFPDLFLTFTCNPNWPELKRYCEENSLNSPDTAENICRVFKMKLQLLLAIIKKKKIFGKVRADIYTIEFQKRGLPHAHILLFLDEPDKIQTPEQVDKVIKAEIPDKEQSPLLYELVQNFMIHGPCGSLNPKSPCMKDKKCSKYFPKKYHTHTTLDEQGYPTYQRREDGRYIEKNGISLDNRFVVPYNPQLLMMFQAHLNVEKTNQSRAIKYLFKYVSKGNDRVIATLYENDGEDDTNNTIDEIKQYYDCRYISSCEAAWRIFGFDTNHRYPPVERLSFHLPGQQSIIYNGTANLHQLLQTQTVKQSMFLSWMICNQNNTVARTLTYTEFPHFFVYDRRKRIWKPRKKGFSIGRMHHVSPSTGELYYLRILLNKIKGPQSFDDIKTINNIVYPSFREACYALGLLDDDQEYIDALKEAAVWASGYYLRKLFASMLLTNCLSRPKFVWSETSELLSEDLLYIPHANEHYADMTFTTEQRKAAALMDIHKTLQKNGRTLEQFLQLDSSMDIRPTDSSNYLILDELNVDKNALQVESDKLVSFLTPEQKFIFDTVIHHTNSPTNKFFFVYGYGGTGKTFLWNALSSSLRATGNIVINVASSGIAATLLPGGRTAHSRFAIPIEIHEESICNIKQNSHLADLLRMTKLIIWDEAPMVKKHAIEAFDRTMRDIMRLEIPNSYDLPFGGKCLVMGGDFRQILPVIPKASRADIINNTINSSYLWNHCELFQLTINMRLQSASTSTDQRKLKEFSQWLLDIGSGKFGTSDDGINIIQIPHDLLITQYTDPLEGIVSAIYPDLCHNLSNPVYFTDRAILAPNIETVTRINDFICKSLPGESIDFFSSDSICKTSTESDSFEDLYPTEFLNTIDCSGMPTHKLTLKVGAPIMLLRNIDQSSGLCNGTRLRITELGNHVIEAITLNGSHPNQKVLIHRMDMNPSESRWPFKMQRRQFPITLSFAMTINKSQGQSLQHVGVFLPKPVFTHGQLYVALSRTKSMSGLKILVHDSESKPTDKTVNVVYQEVFQNLKSYDGSNNTLSHECYHSGSNTTST